MSLFRFRNMTIAPLSTASTVIADINKHAREIAQPYLTFFARDYEMVQIKVTFADFDVLCGDIVSLTDTRIPNTLGRTGVPSMRPPAAQSRWAPRLSPRPGAGK